MLTKLIPLYLAVMPLPDVRHLMSVSIMPFIASIAVPFFRPQIYVLCISTYGVQLQACHLLEQSDVNILCPQEILQHLIRV
jgi:hypothetical protein